MSDFALNRDELLYKVIANKAVRGYQLEFATATGESYFGFVIGLDEDQVQIITTPFGKERGNTEHKFGHYDLAEPGGKDRDYQQWIYIASIVAISENRLCLRHFVPASRQKIEKSQRVFVQRCEAFLKSIGEGVRA